MKIKKIVIIIVLLFSAIFMLKSCMLFSPFSISDFWRSNDETSIPLPEEKKEAKVEIPVFNVPYLPVTEEMKNMKPDCKNEQNRDLYYKKEKTSCFNVYTANAEEVKKEIEKSKSTRFAFYGRYSVYNCPANPKKRVDNLVEGCLESAKFFDNYLFPKMVSIYNLSGANRGFFTERLKIYFEESEEYVTKVCKSSAIGCCLWDRFTILLPLGTNNYRFYPEGQSYTVGFYLKNISSEKYLDHVFQVVYPKNCNLPQYTIHELIHYFNHRVYGKNPSWFEETVNNIFEDELTGQICPPGLKYKVFKFNGGRMDPIDIDMNSGDFILYLQDKRFENNECRKAIVSEVNRLFNERKWNYFGQIYYQLNSFSRKNYDKQLTTGEIAAAVYKSSGSDQETGKHLYETAKCPK